MIKEKNKNNKQGFTLTEVIISTIVMTIILGSVLAFTQYAGDIWNKGNDKISSQNYSRMAFEVLKQDLLVTNYVYTPSKNGNNASTISYKINNKRYDVYVATGTLIKKLNSSIASESMRIAKNVNLFNVQKLSKKSFEISLQIISNENEEATENNSNMIISSESMVLLAPGNTR